jgi:hypothetical protein
MARPVAMAEAIVPNPINPTFVASSLIFLEGIALGMNADDGIKTRRRQKR